MRFVSVVLATLLLDLAGSGCHDVNSPPARPEMAAVAVGAVVAVVSARRSDWISASWWPP